MHARSADAGASEILGTTGAGRPRHAFRGLLNALEDHARERGGAEAFRFLPDEALREAGAGGVAWTWRELRDRARGVARELADSGAAAPGDRVLLVHPAGLDFVAAFLGCLYLGAIPVPVSPPRRREKLSRWEHVSRDAGASALIVAPALLDRLAPLARDLAIGRPLAPAAADPTRPFAPRADAAPPPATDPAGLAFLQYTSGSTSAPKGVMVTHAMLAANLEQIRRAFDYRAGDRILGWMPHYHDMGLVSGALIAIHLGVPSALTSPAAFLRDPMRFLELAGQLGATVIGGPNFAWEHCLGRAAPEALARIDLSRLRLAFTGAEPIRPDTLRSFAETFGPCGFSYENWRGCYGMAEATVCVSVTPAGAGPRTIAADAAALAAGAVRPGTDAELVDSGAPAPGIDVAIVDPASGSRLPPGRVGEIWARGPNVASGYWRKPEISAETFGLALEGTSGWLRTGDLGALIDGRLYVTGRLKEIIVARGRNHYPQDLEETAARAHPDILPGRVAAFPVEGGGEGGGYGLVCELHRRACREPRPEPVFSALRTALGEAHGLAPRLVALAPPGELPVTPSGKIQRFACRDGLDPDGPLQAIAIWRATGREAPAPAAPAAAAGRPVGDLAAALRAAPPPLRRARLLAHLREALARAAGGAEKVSDARRFFDIGLDSLSGVELVAGLERALDMQIDATIIYEHPTPAALADHLMERLFGAPDGRGGGALPPDEAKGRPALLASDS